MPLRAPYDSESGKTSMEMYAARFLDNFGWVVRWTREMLSDDAANMKKLAALMFHLANCREVLDTFRDGNGDAGAFLEALKVKFDQRAGGSETTVNLNAALKEFYTEAGSFLTFVDTNFPATNGKRVAYYVIVGSAAQKFAAIEEYVTVTPVPAVLVNRLTALRATFT